MRLYRYENQWYRTQQEFLVAMRDRGMAQRIRSKDHAVDVPTDHTGLCDFLNGLTRPEMTHAEAVAEASPKPTNVLLPRLEPKAMTEAEARQEVRDWTLARARFRVVTFPEPTLLERAEWVRKYRAESAQIYNNGDE